MKSTLAKMKNIKLKGKLRIPWAEREIDEYVDYLEHEYPQVAQRLERTPYVKFHGSPHETAKKNDPWHASVVFRRKDDFKGSGVSHHLYPNGTVVPSKSEFPAWDGATPAAPEDVGADNAHWLDPEYVGSWLAADKTEMETSKKKDKGKGKAKSDSHKKNPHHHHSSKKHRHTGGSSSKAESSDSSPYMVDPNTEFLYRYAENGGVVYLDTES
ncbi:hypothetical protein MY11210_008723 [Beauveria gryllotalpidicola]